MRKPLLALGVFFVLLLATRDDLHKCLTQPRHDFQVYYYTARSVLEGGGFRGNAALAARHGVDLLPWIYPPPSVVAFFPFALLPFPAAQFLFQGAQLAAFVLLVFLLGRLAAPKDPAWASVVFVVWCAPFAQKTFTHGQVTFFTAVLLSLALLALREEDDRRAGLLMAVSTLFKPGMAGLYFVPLALLARRWRVFAWWGGGVLVGSVLGLLAFGPAPWLQFFRDFAGVARRILIPKHYLLMVAPVLAFYNERREP